MPEVGQSSGAASGCQKSLQARVAVQSVAESLHFQTSILWKAYRMMPFPMLAKPARLIHPVEVQNVVDVYFKYHNLMLRFE